MYDGLPIAADYLSKNDGLEALMTSIKKAIRLKNKFKKFKDTEINYNNLAKDYRNARAEAITLSKACLGVAFTGIIIIFISIISATTGIIENSIPGIIAGTITQTISILFYRRSDAANKRSDKFHKEHILAINNERLNELLSHCDGFSTPEGGDACRKRIIDEIANLT